MDSCSPHSSSNSHSPLSTAHNFFCLNKIIKQTPRPQSEKEIVASVVALGMKGGGVDRFGKIFVYSFVDGRIDINISSCF
jgi:hypothetical protein